MDKTSLRRVARGSERPQAPDRELRPKRLSTKALLIETGERLFGQHGFDGISLREIASAAGQANSNVVQYHFEDKNGLISAILKDRLTRIEASRNKHLTELEAGKKLDARELLKLLWLPPLAIRDDDGNHTFCRFLLQYQIQPRLSHHPLFTYPYNRAPNEKSSRTLSVVRATSLLYEHYSHLRRPLFARRMAALSMMFHSSVVEYDNARLRGSWRVPREFDGEPILDMAIGALSAPG